MKGFKTNLNLICAVALIFFAGTVTVNAQRYSGRGSAARVTVTTGILPVLTTAVADTGSLPSAGGNITLTSASVNVPNILTVGDSTVNTSGSGNSSQSQADVNSLNVGVLNGLTATAGVITANTQCNCPAATCTGTSSIANLHIVDDFGTVTDINGTALPNTTITLRAAGGLVIGTIIVNEQISSAGSKTVNALHINLTVAGTNTDIIIASAHSDIVCIVPPPANLYSGRAFGIMSQDVAVLGTDVSSIVSDTGFLPSSGGKINVTTAAATLPGLLTSGTVTSDTYGGTGGAVVTDVNSSASDSTVQNLAINAGPLLSVTAVAVESDTRCTCSLGVPTCTGDSTLTNLQIAVVGFPVISIPLHTVPNFVVSLPLGLGSITINEQTPVSPTSTGAITVNALHLNLNVVTLVGSDTIIASSHSDIACAVIPSAAGVEVSGRVIADGRPLRNATVTITNQKGVARTVMTNATGSYRFDDVSAGESYVIGARSKLYRFASRVLQVDDTLSGVDFVAQE